MKKLALAEEPIALPDAVFLDATDGEHALADYRGKWVVLNFWATWCAPCVKSLANLQPIMRQLGDSLLVLGLNEQLPSVWQPFLRQKAWRLNALLEVAHLKKLFPHVIDLD